VFGDNQPIVKDPKTIFELIMENFEDEMLRILCGAAAVSLVLGIATEGLREGWLEGASILVAVVIIVSVTSINNYIKEKQFRKLNEMATQKNVNVIRHGNQNRISVYDLQVGDLVEIETGEILSVDGVLVEGSNVTADESAITGKQQLIQVKASSLKRQCQKRMTIPTLVLSSLVVPRLWRVLDGWLCLQLAGTATMERSS
jgi:Ca2+ transporting ATPase